MATLEELEQRVADLEQYVEEQATHTLAYSAEQVDAFFATVDARVLSAGTKTVELESEARYKDVTLTASDLGVTNITNDIKLVFTVHALDYRYGDFYHYGFATSVMSTTDNKLVLRFTETMRVPEAPEYIPKIPAGTYKVNWLRIG
jgi:hypothetical protein